MPEGPEVKYLCNLLNTAYKSQTLNSLQILSGRYTKKPPVNLKNFTTSLPAQIHAIQNKGKFLYITLNNGWYIWFTLGLTGTFYKNCEGKARDERGIYIDKYCRIRFNTSTHPFFFSDMRNFGTIAFHKSPELLEKKLNELGDDPLEATTPKITAEQLKNFKTAIRKQRNQNQPIGALLLNQKVLAGVGNYIRSMALYQAKISPHRPLASLTDADISKLYTAIKRIMWASYKKQLKSGLHTFKLQIYRKTHSPNGYPVIADEMPKGRTIYWVKESQH